MIRIRDLMLRLFWMTGIDSEGWDFDWKDGKRRRLLILIRTNGRLAASSRCPHSEPAAVLVL